jgi:hypothetical protein
VKDATSVVRTAPARINERRMKNLRLKSVMRAEN